MPRTEQLLRDTLAELAIPTRDPDVVADRLAARDRRSRTAGTFWSRPAPKIVAAVAVLGLVIGLAIGVPRWLSGRRADPVAHPSAWHQSFVLDAPAGWTVTARNLGPDDQSTSISGPADAFCLIEVGSSVPRYRTPTRRTTVSIGGVTGAYGPLDPNFGPGSFGVLWDLAKGMPASVSCDHDDQAMMTGLAERVRAGSTPMHVPFRLSGLPAGMTATQLIESWDAGRHEATFQLESTTAPPGTRGLTMQIDTSNMAGFPDPVEEQVINGSTIQIRSANQTVCFPKPVTAICISGPGDEPASDWGTGQRDVALQTARMLTPVDDPTDVSTWLDADEALPQ